MKSNNYCSSFVNDSSTINNNHTTPEVRQPSRKMVNIVGKIKNVPIGVQLAVNIKRVDNPKPTQALKHMGQLTNLPKKLDLPIKFLNDSNMLP